MTQDKTHHNAHLMHPTAAKTVNVYCFNEHLVSDAVKQSNANSGIQRHERERRSEPVYTKKKIHSNDSICRPS